MKAAEGRTCDHDCARVNAVRVPGGDAFGTDGLAHEFVLGMS